MKKWLCACFLALLLLGAVARADTAENMQIIYTYITETMGYNRAVACGIMANIKYECSYNHLSVGNGGSSYGLCQWTGVRKENLIAYCEKNGYDSWKDIYGQLSFMAYELEHNRVGVGNYLKTLPDTPQGAYDAAYKFCVSFEVPNKKEQRGYTRGTYAVKTLYTKYGGSYGEYKVTFDSCGGSGAPEPCTKLEGIPVTLPSACPVRAGYSFLGWSTDSGAEKAQYAAGGLMPVNADTVLYAVWAVCDQSGLIFSDNGGTWLVTGYNGTETQVTVPETLEGKTVTAVAEGAFTESEAALTVLLSESVTEIADDAFNENAVLAALPGSAAYNYARKNKLAFVCLYGENTAVLPSELVMLEEGAFADTDFMYADLANTSLFALPENCFAGTNLKQIHLNGIVSYIAQSAIPEGTVIVAPAGSYAQTFAENNGYAFLEDLSQ